VEAGYLEHQEKRRNQRALWGANSNRAKDLWGALEDETALATGEARLNPGNQIGGVPSFGEDTSQLVCTDIGETTFDVQEKSRYFEGSILKKAYFVGEGSNSVETAQTGQGPRLIGVFKAKGAGGCGETKGRQSFEYLGDGFE